MASNIALAYQMQFHPNEASFDQNLTKIYDKLTLLSQYKNLIMKFGRFIPNQKPHYDEILGVNLASNNQYARRIS